MAYTVDNLSKYLIEQGTSQVNAIKAVEAVKTILACPYAGEIVYIDFDWVCNESPLFTIVMKNEFKTCQPLRNIINDLVWNSRPDGTPDNINYNTAFEFGTLPESFFDDEEEPHGFAIWEA